MKIAINRCFGGFGLSRKAVMLYSKYAGLDLFVDEENSHGSYASYYLDKEKNISWWYGDLARDDPVLIKVVEELGEEANGDLSKLKIVEIPDNTQNWYIHDYDGREDVRTGDVYT